MDESRPIIVIKKKGRHGGHQVAAHEAIAGYFKDPPGTANKLGTTMEGKGQNSSPPKDDMGKLKAELEKAISQMPNLDKLKNQIEITVSAEELRIEMLESAKETSFDLGAPNPNDNGRELLNLLAGELGKLPDKISIEGHTDSKIQGTEQ
jgi:chemotaxis protein MotB